MSKSAYRNEGGFTLLEVVLTLAILGVLAAIAVVAYRGYIQASRTASAINQITGLELVIDDYQREYQKFPSTLAEVDNGTLLDPWGHPYQYLDIADTASIGMVRKDHNLVPINTDYDLYSMGLDGQSKPPLTAPASKDDIIRANNGRYVGLASGY